MNTPEREAKVKYYEELRDCNDLGTISDILYSELSLGTELDAAQVIYDWHTKDKEQALRNLAEDIGKIWIQVYSPGYDDDTSPETFANEYGKDLYDCLQRALTKES